MKRLFLVDDNAGSPFLGIHWSSWGDYELYTLTSTAAVSGDRFLGTVVEKITRLAADGEPFVIVTDGRFGEVSKGGYALLHHFRGRLQRGVIVSLEPLHDWVSPPENVWVVTGDIGRDDIAADVRRFVESGIKGGEGRGAEDFRELARGLHALEGLRATMTLDIDALRESSDVEQEERDRLVNQVVSAAALYLDGLTASLTRWLQKAHEVATAHSLPEPPGLSALTISRVAEALDRIQALARQQVAPTIRETVNSLACTRDAVSHTIASLRALRRELP